MKIIIGRKYLVVSFSILLAVITGQYCEFVQADEFEPATFSNIEKTLLPKLDFPQQSVEGIVIIRGAVVVARFGLPGGFYIYSDPTAAEIFGPYEEAVSMASILAIPAAFGRTARLNSRVLSFNPAKIEGRRKDVWFNLSVVFNKNGEEKSIRVYPSLLYHVDNYGLDYSDPQRVIDEPIPRSCEGKGLGNGIWLAVEIDSRGKAGNARVVSGDGTEECQSSLVDVMLNSKYIPARRQQEFVNATFVEAFF